MTTEVHVSISGNKAVHVINGASQKIMQPGSHHKFLIHGDVSLSIAEIGEFTEEAVKKMNNNQRGGK